MNHDEMKDQLYAFCDGELPKEQSEALAVHLESCPECRKELELWKRVSSAFFSKPAFEIPSDFCDRVMESVRARKQPAVPRWASLLDMLFLPRWETFAALTVFMIGIFCVSMDQIVEQHVSRQNPALSVYSQDGTTQWAASSKEISPGEVLGTLVDDENHYSEPERYFYE